MNQSLIDCVNVWVVPSAYLTVNVWLAWLPLTAVARNWSEAYWPAGRLMVCPVALTTSLEPAAPMVKGVPFQVWLVPSRLAERAAPHRRGRRCWRMSSRR